MYIDVAFVWFRYCGGDFAYTTTYQNTSTPPQLTTGTCGKDLPSGTAQHEPNPLPHPKGNSPYSCFEAVLMMNDYIIGTVPTA